MKCHIVFTGDIMIDVVCLKHGEVYDWSWVDKLYNGAVRSFTEEVNFHVFTDKIDESKPYNQILLPDLGNKAYEKNAGAWWYKMWLFSDEHPLQRNIIYFDLDNIFVGNCDFMLECPEDKFGGILEWQMDISNTSRYMLNSSIMKFTPEKYKYLWDGYNEEKEKIQLNYHSDQDYIAHKIDRSTVHPFDNKQKVLSYAYSMVKGGVKEMHSTYVSRSKGIIKFQYNNPDVEYVLPETASIVICNGYKYKPSLMTHLQFIKDYWR